MELLQVIHNIYGTTIIMRPSWQDDVLGLDWEDDSERESVNLGDTRLYFDHPDSEQTLTKVLPGECIAVEGAEVPAGLYRAGDELMLIPVALSNWGVARVWVEGKGIMAIENLRGMPSCQTRLTGCALNRAQGSEWLYGAAVAACQFGTPFISSVVGFIDDGEYVLAARNDGSKAWLEVA